MTDRRRILDRAGRLIDAIGRADFPRVLRQSINALAPIDSFIVLAYHPRRAPVILHDELRREERDVFFEHYLTGAYLLSPFYQACMSGTEPRFHLISEIVPDGFFESEFCKVYYAPAGIVDEGGYILPHGCGGALVVSVGRVLIENPFAAEEAAVLQDFLPVLTAAVRRHWPPGTPPNHVEDIAQPTIREHLQAAFESFGTSLLTGRERDVALLMLRGHSSKSAARLLDISPDTERVHRRNIYEKLSISSQAELCSLFFEALAEEPGGEPADPLASLLDRRATLN
jgi:DNA-binding CsgD family transcriptional regulator